MTPYSGTVELLMVSLLHFAPLIAALLLVRLVPLRLRIMQGVFLLTVASVAMLSQMGHLESPLASLLVAALVAEVTHFCMLGFGILGSARNHAAVLFTIGLFPWHLGFLTGVLFVTLAFLFIGAGSLLKIVMASSSVGYTTANPMRLKMELDEESYQAFLKKASMFLATPLLCAAIFFAVMVALF